VHVTPTPKITTFPFMMSLNNNLLTFRGKAEDMSSKFITDFELRASGLVGDDDEALLRAVRQLLADSALTWFG
ncbi:unnamed protein product, partial [Didymodactylos carnosus]